MRTKYIKQYGIQRSGTNFMRAVFEMNLDCRVLANIGGWKHGIVTNETDMKQVKTELTQKEIDKIDKRLKKGKIPKVVVIKDPFCWIVDIAAYSKKEITDKFITQQIARYVSLNEHWIGECDMIINYGDLLLNTEKVVNEAVKCFKLKRTTEKLVIAQNNMLRGGDVPARKNVGHKPFDSSFYRNRLFMNRFNKDQIDIIHIKTEHIQSII